MELIRKHKAEDQKSNMDRQVNHLYMVLTQALQGVKLVNTEMQALRSLLVVDWGCKTLYSNKQTENDLYFTNFVWYYFPTAQKNIWCTLVNKFWCDLEINLIFSGVMLTMFVKTDFSLFYFFVRESWKKLAFFLGTNIQTYQTKINYRLNIMLWAYIIWFITA